MGRMEYWNPVTQSRKPIKSWSIVDNSGLEYTPDDIKNLENNFYVHQADGASHSKTARFVVGTSTAGWTLEDCDYLCDGTADQ